MTTEEETAPDAVTTVGIITFDRSMDIAERLQAALADTYQSVTIRTYDDTVFADCWEQYDCLITVMASGIVIRSIAPLLADKWTDPAVIVVDPAMTNAVPLIGGHHGGHEVLRTLTAGTDLTPVVTTASTASGKQSIEERAGKLDATIVNGDSTVTTNLAVLNDELGPVERLDGPRAVLVDDAVTVLKRTGDDAIVLGTGSTEGATPTQFREAWDQALQRADRTWSDVEFIATGTLKADENRLHTAADQQGLGVVSFEKATLQDFAGPTCSRSEELIDWPGIAEASAKAGSRRHELLVERLTYDSAVTVAVGW